MFKNEYELAVHYSGSENATLFIILTSCHILQINGEMFSVVYRIKQSVHFLKHIPIHSKTRETDNFIVVS